MNNFFNVNTYVPIGVQWRKASQLSSDIVDLDQVLKRLNEQNDFLALALLLGKAVKIFNISCIRGKYLHHIFVTYQLHSHLLLKNCLVVHASFILFNIELTNKLKSCFIISKQDLKTICN